MEIMHLLLNINNTIHFSKESLSREKSLEDILVRVKALIHKNIGKSDVDLMKTFEDVKHELMSLNDTDTEKQNIAEGIDEKVRITYTVSAKMKIANTLIL